MLMSQPQSWLMHWYRVLSFSEFLEFFYKNLFLIFVFSFFCEFFYFNFLFSSSYPKQVECNNHSLCLAASSDVGGSTFFLYFFVIFFFFFEGLYFQAHVCVLCSVPWYLQDRWSREWQHVLSY